MWALRLHTLQARLVNWVTSLGSQAPKVRVNVSISHISAERFWEIKRPLPPVKISTNLNLVSVDKTQDESLEVPFVFTISYNPSVAQLSVKGKAHVAGDSDKLNEIYEAYRKKKAPQPMIIQTISNVVFLESLLVSKTLNIPPPIPLPKMQQGPPSKRKTEPSYRA